MQWCIIPVEVLERARSWNQHSECHRLWGGEGYIDLSTEEKALAWWDVNCQPAPDQTNTVGVPLVPGEGCKKCDLRDMDQVFGGSGPAGITFISKTKAEAIVKQNRKNPHVIPHRLLNFLIFQNEFDEEHVAHVSRVQTPGIIACGGWKLDGKNIIFCYLVDGTHRAVAAKRSGRPFEAYVLSLKETAECVLRR